MRTKTWIMASVMLVVMAMRSAPTLGEERVAFTLDLSGEVDIFDSSQAQGYVLGWTFYVPGPLSIYITQVGVFDADGLGLGSQHEIGIWYYDYDNAEWVTVPLPTVPAGDSTDLFENYQYVEVEPAVELTANPGAVEDPPTQSAYTIGVLFPQGNQDDYLVRIWDDPVEFDTTETVKPWSSLTKPGEYSRDLISDVLDKPGSGPYNDQRGLNVNFRFTTTPPGPTQVEIDIKPGSDPNPINPGSNGVIPVAIFTTETFDAATVDAGTVTLAGAEVAVRGKSEKLMARLEDVDGDGDDDLLLQVDTQSDGAIWESGPVTLSGQTYDGEAIQGTDYVIIVPP